MLTNLKTAMKDWRRNGRFPRLTRLSACIWRHAHHIRHAPSLPTAIRRLAELSNEPPLPIAALVSLAIDGLAGTIRPLQVRSEITSFVTLVHELRPSRCLEIGTANGGTLFLLCRSSAPDAHIMSVDLPGGWFGGGYPAWKKRLYHAFALPSQRLELFRVDSHAPGTFTAIRHRLAGERLDVLFLDGDHTYDGVKADFGVYSSLVRPGGIIAFHDIVPNPLDADCQVFRFWQEIRRAFRHQEFVEDQNQAGKGIGVLFV